MYKCLSPGAIGIRVTLAEGINLAAETGFEGLAFAMPEAAGLVEERGVAYVKNLFARAGVRMGSWGFPVEYRREEATYQAELAALPRLARVAQQLGATRCATWMLPFSDELRFVEYFDLMVRRLRPAAQILADHGIRFGLEFVGPGTLRQGHRYSFISSMQGMLGLCGAIGTGNMGLLFDSFHWYTAYGTAQDIASLRNDDVVLVHLNDGLTGRGPDEQIDQERALPGETGVIDLTTFLRGLDAIGYDGPVVVEPFSDRVKAMPPHEAATATMDALRYVYSAAGLV
jgi:sugar phosphate isomerase/epimerase